MKNRLFSYLSLSTFYLIGCEQLPPATPSCRVAAEMEQQDQGNAACIVRLDDKLLTITHRLSGKLDLPGGTAQANETAQCTAHRETFEETGFNVEVGQLLAKNENNMHFYACILSGNFNGEIQRFPVPQWSKGEVASIQLLDPYVIHDSQWRFPEQFVAVRSMWNRVTGNRNSADSED